MRVSERLCCFESCYYLLSMSRLGHVLTFLSRSVYYTLAHVECFMTAQDFLFPTQRSKRYAWIQLSAQPPVCPYRNCAQRFFFSGRAKAGVLEVYLL